MELCNTYDYQVAEPLRAMVMGAPLEDARHLAQRYDRMRQEAEVQVNSFSIIMLYISYCFYYIPSLDKKPHPFSHSVLLSKQSVKMA
jgi:hypothetical protein